MSDSQVTRLYVSTNGNDRWSGSRKDPNRSRTDGPFATLPRAQKAVRQIISQGMRSVRVELRAGVYQLAETLTFGPADSVFFDETKLVQGRFPETRVTYAAHAGEDVVISGGRRITGWRESVLNGRKAWQTFLPEVKKGQWNFTQLWVNGRRAARTRLPQKGIYRIAELPKAGTATPLFRGQDRFVFKEGDIKNWKNIADIEFVALHYWIESRINLVSIDFKKRIAGLAHKSRMSLTANNKPAPYYLENIFEALQEPGQWYLDRPAGTLYYLPKTSETISAAAIYAPALSCLMRLKGDAKKQRYAQGLDFEGLTFAHTEWTPDPHAKKESAQASCHLSGAISFDFARNCSMRKCRLMHVGSYAVELLNKCMDIDIRRNIITDLAGGGIKIWHTCRRNYIEDNQISDGGHRFHSAVGVLIGRSSGNKICHNHIHDFDYSGISVGWRWGYAEGEAYGNIVEYNHIHHIGRGMLSDLGGIYTLSVSPGTRIRYNVIHDVDARDYGGFGIYNDEGSSEILVENNLVYRTMSNGFNFHYGWHNIVRNNIFAFGRESQICRGRAENQNSLDFTENIIICDADKAVVGEWSEIKAVFDNNIYFNVSGTPMSFGGKIFSEWQKLGLDQHSKIADPLFVNPLKGDFRLSPKSPARAMGFIPFNICGVGPRRESHDASAPSVASTGFISQFELSSALPSAGDLTGLKYPQDRSKLKFKPRTFMDRVCDLHEDVFACAPRDVMVYFLCQLRCDERMRLNICLGYDGPVKVWIDKKVACHDPQGTNPASPDKAFIPFSAKPGQHEILIALGSNYGKAWGIVLRILRRDVSRRQLKQGLGSYAMPQIIGSSPFRK